MTDDTDEAEHSAPPNAESGSNAENPAVESASWLQVLTAMQAAEAVVSAAVWPDHTAGNPATLVGEDTPSPAPSPMDQVTAAMQAAEAAVAHAVQSAAKKST